MMLNPTTTKRARKADILFAAQQLARTGTFTTARVVRFLGIYGMEVLALDAAARIEAVLLGSGEYCTDEAGTFAAV